MTKDTCSKCGKEIPENQGKCVNCKKKSTEKIFSVIKPLLAVGVGFATKQIVKKVTKL